MMDNLSLIHSHSYSESLVKPPIVQQLPEGYTYGVTRFADIILQRAFADRFQDLCTALNSFRPTLAELRAGGGGRTPFVRRFDQSLRQMRHHGQSVWRKQKITIHKWIEFDEDIRPASKVRSHEIDMFGVGSLAKPLPGVAVEMEWNNKDPFFDRDLNNFQALHREEAIAVGVIVTRGPTLQKLISRVIRSKDGKTSKYGTSTTHWDKLIPRVDLGGGGGCPLLLIGIEPERIEGLGSTREAVSTAPL